MSCDASDTRLQISNVIQEIHRALVDSETRRSLESEVCSAFAKSSPYVFAWVGVHDPATDQVIPRASGGVDSAYLDEITIFVTDSSTRQGPTARAIRTGQIQVMQDIRNDPEYEPWRKQALAHGFESSAAVPIVNDTDDYGVLNLYADRSAAFDGREKQLLTELGETIATAIAGIEARVELEEQKEKYERLTTRISDGYYGVDSEWRITYWNEQMAKQTGRPADDVCGRTLWEAFPSIEGTELERKYRRGMADGESESFEYYLDDPFDYWLEIDVYPDAEGLSIFSREITARKQRELQRRETNTILRTIVENLPSGLLVEDANRNVLVANELLCELLEIAVDSEALIGRDCATAARDIADLFVDSDGFVDGIETRIEERIAVQNETLELDDGRILERDYVPYELPEGDGNLWLYRDVTEQKDRERKLERSRQIIKNSTDIATIIDPSGTIRYVSPAVEQVLGYDQDELIGEDGFAYQPPETTEAVAEAIEYVITNPDETRTVQTQFRRADDSWCWIESTIRNRIHDDIIEGILVSSRDVTERMEYEQRIEDQRDDLQTLNEVVRHDVRNDLQLVTAYTEMLADLQSEGGEEKEIIDKLRERANQAVDLTKTAADMATVMLQKEGVQAQVSLRQVFVTEIDDIQDAYPDAEISVEGDVASVKVQANEMLKSVFRNLLKNAIQHNDKAVPSIRATVRDHDDRVHIRIADNGPGVADLQKDQIFGKAQKGLDSEGTGIGLHLVQTLVTSYGGDVWVEDNDPVGSVFVVELLKAT